METCAICLSEINDNEKSPYIGCRHVFHKKCILDVMKSRHKCPLCNFDICNHIVEDSHLQEFILDNPHNFLRKGKIIEGGILDVIIVVKILEILNGIFEQFLKLVLVTFPNLLITTVSFNINTANNSTGIENLVTRINEIINNSSNPPEESTGSTAESTGATVESTCAAAESTGSTAESTGATTESTGATTESTGATAESTCATAESTGATTESTGATAESTDNTEPKDNQYILSYYIKTQRFKLIDGDKPSAWDFLKYLYDKTMILLRSKHIKVLTKYNYQRSYKNNYLHTVEMYLLAINLIFNFYNLLQNLFLFPIILCDLYHFYILYKNYYGLDERINRLICGTIFLEILNRTIIQTTKFLIIPIIVLKNTTFVSCYNLIVFEYSFLMCLFMFVNPETYKILYNSIYPKLITGAR